MAKIEPRLVWTMVAAVALVLTVPGVAIGQTASETVDFLPSPDDKTGTNPLNLQQTVSVSNDFAALPDGLFWNMTAYRYAVPLAGRRVAVSVELPLVLSNVTGRTEAAFGDLRAGAVWTPWLAERKGLLVGLDTSWSTATNDALGAGRHRFTPFAQFVLFPSSSTIVAPRYGHRFSTGGEEDVTGVNESVLGVYAVWWATPTMWVVVEPEMVVDWEWDETTGEVAFEYGRLLFGGVGTYVRPGIGVGRVGAKPFDWAIEFGFRIIP